MKANPVDLLDKLSPNFTIRNFKAEYHCPECQNEQLELEYNYPQDGDMCLTDILDSALIENGWCDSLGVCPACKKAYAASEREANMVDDAREAVSC